MKIEKKELYQEYKKLVGESAMTYSTFITRLQFLGFGFKMATNLASGYDTLKYHNLEKRFFGQDRKKHFLEVKKLGN